MPEKCLVSSCLVGLCTRYDGRSKVNTICMQVLQQFHYIPVCPEQLGGLPTPRSPADLVGGNGRDVLEGCAAVITSDRTNVTRQFIAGAEAVLKIAQDQRICFALLKGDSPSCGLTQLGVTGALLLANGIRSIEF